MREGLAKIREEWFRGSPPEKLGVTERYVVFGETRAWVVDQLRLSREETVLDLGFGHGFFSFEMASRTHARVVGLDFDRSERGRTAKGGARIAGQRDRIDWTLADGRMMPFTDGTFDAVASFLSLQDVYMTGGASALERVLENSCKILKRGGLLALADNLFPECARDDRQQLYARIHQEEFHAMLPSKEVVIKKLRGCGLANLWEHRYDPRIVLNENESRIELLDIADARPFGMVFDFDRLWAKYRAEIGELGLAYPDILLIQGRKT